MPTATVRWKLTVRDIRPPGGAWEFKAYGSYVGVWGRDPAILTWDTSANEDVVVIKSPETGGEYCMYWARDAWRTSSARGCKRSSDPSDEHFSSGWHYFCVGPKYAGCSYPGQLEFEWQPISVTPGTLTPAPTATPMPAPTPTPSPSPVTTPSPSQKPPNKETHKPSSTTRPSPLPLACILISMLLVWP